MRLFTAFELPPEVRAEVNRIQQALGALPFRRWQPPKNLHLTVHFLGDVESARLASLEEGLRNACQAFLPFRLELGQLGAFPRLRHPRTLWMGLEGERERLIAFEAALRPVVTAQGIPLEARPYAPHITLARDPQGPLTIPPEHPRPLAWQASELVLFQSVLERGGALHTPLAFFPLGGSPH